MVRRYALLSVKHLQPYPDQLIFEPKIGTLEEPQKSAESNGAESPTAPAKGKPILVSHDDVSC
jgi:hypothetical protein